jgi:hypothetical protein
MATLTSRRRRKLPRTKFAAPKGKGPNRSKNQYPVDTKGRASNAKARATQAYKKGRMSKSMRDRIHAAANRVLRKSTRGGGRVASRKQIAAAKRNLRKARAARTARTRTRSGGGSRAARPRSSGRRVKR